MRSTANFTEVEWNCKCGICNKQVPHNMLPLVMRNTQMLRDFMRKPLYITSAFRCLQHPSEASKDKGGQHTLGTSVDIKVTNGSDAARIIAYAIKYLGVQGWAYSKRLGFVHLDWRTTGLMTWEY
jgi:zinc D-Ala-D-Ala carboxypeptidase